MGIMRKEEELRKEVGNGEGDREHSTTEWKQRSGNRDGGESWCGAGQEQRRAKYTMPMGKCCNNLQYSVC